MVASSNVGCFLRLTQTFLGDRHAFLPDCPTNGEDCVTSKRMSMTKKNGCEHKGLLWESGNKFIRLAGIFIRKRFNLPVYWYVLGSCVAIFSISCDFSHYRAQATTRTEMTEEEWKRCLLPGNVTKESRNV